MVRRIIAALLVLLATVLAPFAVGAYWAQRTLMDAQQFSETIAPLADDPQVKAVIEAETTTAIIQALDVEQRLPTVLPDVLIQAIASGVNSAVSDGVDRFVNSERFGSLWTTVTEGLQQGFVRLVNRDEEGAVSLEEGKLVLNTTEVLTTVQQQLVADGIPLVGNVDVTKYGKDIVLADTPNLQIVVDALAIFLPVARWVWVLVLALFVAGVLLWRPRSRGLLWTGLGLALGGIVTWAALGLGQAMLGDAAGTPQLGTLVTTVTETLTRFLANALLVMVALGIALMVAAWLAGATRSGRRVRDNIRGLAHRLGTPLADGPVGRGTARMPLLVPILRGLVIVGALWWAVAADPLYPSTVAWILVTVGALLFCIEVLEGAGLGRDDASSGAVTGQPPLSPAAPLAPAGPAVPWTGPQGTDIPGSSALPEPGEAPPGPSPASGG